MTSIRGSALLLAVSLLGCQPASTPNQPGATPPVGNEAPTATGSETDQTTEFIAAFRQASERKDLDAMLDLYCWDGLDAEMRETVRGNVQGELRQPVTDLEIVTVDPAQHGPRVEGNIRWRDSIPIVAMLKAKFAKAPPGNGWNVEAGDYGLGVKRGRYLIAVPVRD